MHALNKSCTMNPYWTLQHAHHFISDDTTSSPPHALIYILIYEPQRDKERITQPTQTAESLNVQSAKVHECDESDKCTRSQLFPLAGWVVKFGCFHCLLFICFYLRSVRRPIRFVTICRASRGYDGVGRWRIAPHRARHNYMRRTKDVREEDG